MTPDYEPPSAAKDPDGTWERVTLTDYWSARHKLPYSLLLWAIEHQDDQNALAPAAQMFDHLIEIHPDPPDYFFKNTGIAYGRLRTPVSSGPPHHCKMINSFARFLLSTSELPSTTAEILKIVRDYIKHTKRVKEAGGSPECGEEVLMTSKRASALYKEARSAPVNPAIQQAPSVNSVQGGPEGGGQPGTSQEGKKKKGKGKKKGKKTPKTRSSEHS